MTSLVIHLNVDSLELGDAIELEAMSNGSMGIGRLASFLDRCTTIERDGAPIVAARIKIVELREALQEMMRQIGEVTNPKSQA